MAPASCSVHRPHAGCQDASLVVAFGLETVDVNEQNPLTAHELEDAWLSLCAEERWEGFRLLERHHADDFFLGLGTHEQVALLRTMPEGERRLWLRLLAPDDAANVLRHVSETERSAMLAMLDDPTRREVL